MKIVTVLDHDRHTKLIQRETKVSALVNKRSAQIQVMSPVIYQTIHSLKIKLILSGQKWSEIISKKKVSGSRVYWKL